MACKGEGREEQVSTPGRVYLKQKATRRMKQADLNQLKGTH
jgi:hypothetical protein